MGILHAECIDNDAMFSLCFVYSPLVILPCVLMDIFVSTQYIRYIPANA